MFFAGLTVCIALLGQFALGLPFLYDLAVCSSLTVLLTMLACWLMSPWSTAGTGGRSPWSEGSALARGNLMIQAGTPGIDTERDVEVTVDDGVLRTPPRARAGRGGGPSVSS